MSDYEKENNSCLITVAVTVMNLTAMINLFGLTAWNGETHSNNTSAVADKLLECVWPFFGVGIYRVKKLRPRIYVIGVSSNALIKHLVHLG